MNQLVDTMINGGRPIPGQSLTTDPANPAPYEKPPQFTTVHEASEHIFIKLIDETAYVKMISVLNDGVPIMDIGQTILFKGFTEGKWNPDLMMLLIEPVAYMILALAERAGIDPVIYRDEDVDMEEEEARLFGREVDLNKMNRLKELMTTSSVPKGALSSEMEQQIETLPDTEEMQSLLAPEVPTESLMSAPLPEEELQ
jgi:hypothetical protein